MSPLLSVRNLGVQLPGSGGPVTVLSDIAFDLEPGETLGIVGESGSGKSMLALALIGLLPPGARLSGSIRFEGTELVGAPEERLAPLRGRRIAMVFQEPATALNPAMTIGAQIAEALRLASGMDAEGAERQAARLLDRVRLPQAARHAGAYPHELSGGQRQRVLIAMALSGRPSLLLADEPTTALDVVLQAEILDLLAELVSEERMALLLVSHDIGTIARATARTLVLYAGTRFEAAPTAALMADPANPYTRGLLAAIPRRQPRVGAARARLAAVPGTVPRPGDLPPGCRYAPRCLDAVPACSAAEPDFRLFASARGSRCLFVPAGSPR